MAEVPPPSERTGFSESSSCPWWGNHHLWTLTARIPRWPLAFPAGTRHCPADVLPWCLGRNKWGNLFRVWCWASYALGETSGMWACPFFAQEVSNHRCVSPFTFSALIARRPLQATSANGDHLCDSLARMLLGSNGLCGSSARCNIKKTGGGNLLLFGLWDPSDGKEVEEMMNHQRGWSKVLLEPFSGWKSQVMALSPCKFLSS